MDKLCVPRIEQETPVEGFHDWKVLPIVTVEDAFRVVVGKCPLLDFRERSLW